MLKNDHSDCLTPHAYLLFLFTVFRRSVVFIIIFVVIFWSWNMFMIITPSHVIETTSGISEQHETDSDEEDQEVGVQL